MKLTIRTEVEAEQWLGEGHPLPKDCHLCKPEVHWSAAHDYIYFTYAELWPEHWMGTKKLSEKPKTGGGILESGFMGVTKKDGEAYYREVLDFRIWKVKSESSVKNDHRAVFLDDTDEMAELFVDYVMLEAHDRFEGDKRAAAWREYPMQRAEYRARDGNYGRGYRPVYLKPGDWLIHQDIREGHNNLGVKDSVRVLSDAEFKAVLLSAGNESGSASP